MRRGAESGERVDGDVELVAFDLEVGGGAEDLVEEAAGFVVGSGVVGGEEAGEGGLGVVGGHAGGVVDAFAFRVEPGAVGVVVAEGNLGGDGQGGGVDASELGAGLSERGCRFGGGDRGAATLEGGSAFFGFGGGELGSGVADVAVGVAAGRVRHQSGRVVGAGGVGVEAVEGVVGSHVAEEVLLAPAAEHGVGEGGGVGIGAGGEDLGLVPGGRVEPCDLAAGEASRPVLVLVGDAHRPVGQPVLLGPAQVVTEGVKRERGAGFGGSSLDRVDLG